MKVFNRMMNFMGLGDDEDYDRNSTTSGEPDADEPASEGRRGRAPVVSIHSQKMSKVMLAQPETYEDVRELIEQLRSRRLVLINLQGLDINPATRIVDKLEGAVCAFNGKMVQVGIGIYLCTPDNFEVNGTIDPKKMGAGTKHSASTEV